MRWTLLTVNSSLHCVICLLMSSQYRSVLKRAFLRMENKSVSDKVITQSFLSTVFQTVVVDLRSISVTQKSKDSMKRTY